MKVFPDRRIYEDEATYYKLLYDCETAVKIDDELYYYFFNPYIYNIINNIIIVVQQKFTENENLELCFG